MAHQTDYTAGLRYVALRAASDLEVKGRPPIDVAMTWQRIEDKFSESIQMRASLLGINSRESDSDARTIAQLGASLDYYPVSRFRTADNRAPFAANLATGYRDELQQRSANRCVRLEFRPSLLA